MPTNELMAVPITLGWDSRMFSPSSFGSSTVTDARVGRQVAKLLAALQMRMIRDSGVAGGVHTRQQDHVSTREPSDRESTGAASLDITDLYTKHATAMFRVAVSVVRDHALAEDVVQEAIVKAWRHLDTFRGDSSPKTWLLRITHNTAVSTLRRLRDTPHDPTELPDTPHEMVESSAMTAAFLTAFDEALFDLDELSRSVLALREIEVLPYDEIARILDVPLPTVKTRLFRARHQLATALADWDPT